MQPRPLGQGSCAATRERISAATIHSTVDCTNDASSLHISQTSRVWRYWADPGCNSQTGPATGQSRHCSLGAYA